MGIVTLPSFGSDPATVTAALLDGKVDPLATEFNGNIENTNIKAGAAIAYSKLNLATSIVNADVSASAAIVDTKLATLSTAGKVNFSALVVTSQATGDIAYASSATVWTRLAAGTTSQVLIGGASAPSWGNVPAAAAPSGTIIQVVNSQITTPVDVTTVPPQDDTTPLYQEGNALGSVSITPSNSSNTLLITATGWGTASTDIICTFWLNDGTGTDAALAVRQMRPPSGNSDMFSLEFYVSAASTDARTYYLVGGVSTGTFYFGRGGSGADLFGAASFGSITVREIKA